MEVREHRIVADPRAAVDYRQRLKTSDTDEYGVVDDEQRTDLLQPLGAVQRGQGGVRGSRGTRDALE